jgi:hypothetical protein
MVTFCYGNVTSRGRFVKETFCEKTFCRGNVLKGDVFYVRRGMLEHRSHRTLALIGTKRRSHQELKFSVLTGYNTGHNGM